MENNLEDGPESIASLLGMETPPPAPDFSREGQFSALRVTGLLFASAILFLMLLLNWFHFTDLISSGPTIGFSFVSTLLFFALFVIYKKAFLSFVPEAMAACFSNRSPNATYFDISVKAGWFSFFMVLAGMVLAIILRISFVSDTERLGSLGLPAFWVTFLALIICQLSLVFQHSFDPKRTSFLCSTSGKDRLPTMNGFLHFMWICLGAILILFLIEVLILLAQLLYNYLSNSEWHHTTDGFIYLWIIGLLLATFQKDFIAYIPAALATFYTKSKANIRFAEISRFGSIYAFCGSLLSATFAPIGVLHRNPAPNDSPINIEDRITFCIQSGSWKIFGGFLIFALFKYLQHAFSEKK
jgi:hypothetical protein